MKLIKQIINSIKEYIRVARIKRYRPGIDEYEEGDIPTGRKDYF